MADQKNLHFPYEFKELEPEEREKLNSLYCYFNDAVRVGPKGYVVYRNYKKDAANIYNMPLRSDDIFVASYQRSGTTWTQELVWLLATNFDYSTAESITLAQRYAFLDLFMFVREEQIDEYLELINKSVNKDMFKNIMAMMAIPASQLLATAPSPRFIKTHLPMSLLPPKLLDTAKVVYVARDPRDVIVSSYHHTKLFNMMGLVGDFKEFWNAFIKDLFTLTPYFEHVKEAWEQRSHPNMLFLFYEDLSKALPATVKRVADFLGREVNAVEMSRLCDHLKFDNFKNNKSVNFDELKELGVLAENENFIRKGKAGGWRDYFDEEMTQQAESWIQDNLRDTDLRFPHLQQ